MKSWLTKFRVSSALDAGRPLPERLRRKIAAEPELERFVERSEAFGKSLRSAAVAVAVPSLHDGIMRAVRSSMRPQQPKRAPVFSWVAASAGIAALGTICFWVVHPQSLEMGMVSPLGGLASLLRRVVEGAVLP